MSQSQYADLSNDAGMPLFNRAIGGVYPPGSTFKIVVALAALETQSITPDTVYEDTGVIKNRVVYFSELVFFTVWENRWFGKSGPCHSTQ